ncbi:YdcF family protein [Ciceribacter sp. L1K23]|uniref:YdcF family protein n=1 Tax=Ciceribacter sp. L1K23 TaxID=2820276 RepID=UPI001B80EDC8|nr:YdcF family protein [Ciceribacter sp. L1K23]MBR0557525.1 YdcF family protein [Ciceribacter sp. L1K23]
MFLLSKISWLAIQPLSVAFALLFIGTVLLWLTFRRSALICLSSAVVILFVTLFTTAGAFGLQALEGIFPRSSEGSEDVSCMIVLGGALETEVSTARGRLEFTQAADRFLEMARLATAFPDARIVVSGGDGSFSGTYMGDAEASAVFLRGLGIDASRVIRETSSRTTHENVENTKEMVEKLALPPCLLITSAFHMPRSVGLFRKAGLEVVPWPVDYRTSGKVSLRLDFTQPTANAQLTSTAVREWLGLAAYRLSGHIDQLLPRPD